MDAFERLDRYVERVEAAADLKAIRLLLHGAVAKLRFDYFACSLIDAAPASWQECGQCLWGSAVELSAVRTCDQHYFLKSQDD